MQWTGSKMIEVCPLTPTLSHEGRGRKKKTLSHEWRVRKRKILSHEWRGEKRRERGCDILSRTEIGCTQELEKNTATWFFPVVQNFKF